MWSPAWAASAGGRALMERLGRVVSVPFRAYHRQLSAYPMTVKSLTSSFVLGSADFLSQWLRRPRPTAASGASRSEHAQDEYGHEQHWWNRKQTLCMGLYGGLFVAPFCHTWYHILERIIPVHGAQTVLNKLRLVTYRVIMDQLVVSPVFASGLFLSRGLIAGEDMETIWRKMRSEFFHVVLAGTAVWPPAQMINFFFVPLAYRVLFINMVGFGWSTYTSLIASQAFHHHNGDHPSGSQRYAYLLLLICFGPMIHQAILPRRSHGPITLPPYLPRYTWMHSHPYTARSSSHSTNS